MIAYFKIFASEVILIQVDKLMIARINKRLNCKNTNNRFSSRKNPTLLIVCSNNFRMIQIHKTI